MALKCTPADTQLINVINHIKIITITTGGDSVMGETTQSGATLQVKLIFVLNITP